MVPQSASDSLEFALPSAQSMSNSTKAGIEDLIHDQDLDSLDRSGSVVQKQSTSNEDEAVSTISSRHHLLSPKSHATTLTSSVSGHGSAISAQLPSMELGVPAAQHLAPSLDCLQDPQSLPYGSTSYSSPDNNLTSYSDLVHTMPKSGTDNNFNMSTQSYGHTPYVQNNYNDMIIMSQSIDTSALGLDPLLWLGYVPDDALDCFEMHNSPSTEG